MTPPALSASDAGGDPSDVVGDARGELLESRLALVTREATDLVADDDPAGLATVADATDFASRADLGLEAVDLADRDDAHDVHLHLQGLVDGGHPDSLGDLSGALLACLESRCGELGLTDHVVLLGL